MSQNGTLCTKYVSWDVTSFGLVNNYRHFEYKCQTTRRYISEGLNILYTAAIVFKLEKRHVSVFLYNVHPVEPVGAPPLSHSKPQTFRSAYNHGTVIIFNRMCIRRQITRFFKTITQCELFALAFGVRK